MSISFYLRCKETKKPVHVAEQSSGWFRGADDSKAVGMFCVAHEAKVVDIVDGDRFDDFIEYDIWTSQNAEAEFMALVGSPCVGL